MKIREKISYPEVCPVLDTMPQMANSFLFDEEEFVPKIIGYHTEIGKIAKQANVLLSSFYFILEAHILPVPCSV